jgi:hypothetical protein
MFSETFAGFPDPQENWSKLPHALIEALPLIETAGEVKVILYILRHTWGYQDEEKRITVDEFMNGRRRRDGSRIDDGTGLSKPTILDGLKRAEMHGFIEVEVDDKDKGRVKKFYRLRMQGSTFFTPGVKTLDSKGKESLLRTEKETLERNDDAGPPAAPLLAPDQSEALWALRFMGMDDDAAQALARNHDPDAVRGWCCVAWARHGPDGVTNMAGFVRSKLDDGAVTPDVAPAQMHEFMKWVTDHRAAKG